MLETHTHTEQKKMEIGRERVKEYGEQREQQHPIKIANTTLYSVKIQSWFVFVVFFVDIFGTYMEVLEAIGRL